MDFLQLLNPLAPHLTEEIWSRFQKPPLAYQFWPKIKRTSEDGSQKKVSLIVQINGKTKVIFPTNPNQEQEKLTKEIEKNEKISKYLSGQKIKKIIYVKNKLINFVTI
jgi:leucyl-tRNA synthetase